MNDERDFEEDEVLGDDDGDDDDEWEEDEDELEPHRRKRPAEWE